MYTTHGIEIDPQCGCEVGTMSLATNPFADVELQVGADVHLVELELRDKWSNLLASSPQLKTKIKTVAQGASVHQQIVATECTAGKVRLKDHLKVLGSEGDTEKFVEFTAQCTLNETPVGAAVVVKAPFKVEACRLLIKYPEGCQQEAGTIACHAGDSISGISVQHGIALHQRSQCVAYRWSLSQNRVRRRQMSKANQ